MAPSCGSRVSASRALREAGIPPEHAYAIAAQIQKMVRARIDCMAEAPLGELLELIELRDAGFDEWQARAIVNTCERALKPAPNRWTFWRIATLVVPAAAALVAVGAFVAVILR